MINKLNSGLYEFIIDKSIFHVAFTQCGESHQMSFSLSNGTHTNKYVEVFSTIDSIIFEYLRNNQNISKLLMLISPDSDTQRRISIYKRWLNRHQDWEVIQSTKQFNGNLRGYVPLLLVKK